MVSERFQYILFGNKGKTNTDYQKKNWKSLLLDNISEFDTEKENEENSDH